MSVAADFVYSMRKRLKKPRRTYAGGWAPAPQIGRALFLPLIVLAVFPPAVRADAGLLRLVEARNGYQISVFTSPTPLRAGAVDVSVLVQDALTGTPVAEPQITVRARHRDSESSTITSLATREAATNKLFRAAVFELPQSGWWDVDVHIDGLREPVQVHFDMEVAERLPTWRSLWPWLAWPFAVIVLFAIHQWLLRRRQRFGRPPPGYRCK